jgi:xanthine dehydrogenase iron-sulfur cluster and FAD-binding subunit A
LHGETSRRAGVEHGSGAGSHVAAVREVLREDTVKRLFCAGMMSMFLFSLFVGSAIAQTESVTKTLTGEMKTITATIEAIEKATRSVTLKQENGEYVTITAPAEVAKFDAMKVGDKVTVKYYDNVVLRLKAPGEKQWTAARRR